MHDRIIRMTQGSNVPYRSFSCLHRTLAWFNRNQERLLASQVGIFSPWVRVEPRLASTPYSSYDHSFGSTQNNAISLNFKAGDRFLVWCRCQRKSIQCEIFETDAGIRISGYIWRSEWPGLRQCHCISMLRVR